MTATADEPLHVLIVEDDPLFLDWICATVSAASRFVLFQASTFEEAFTILSAQAIDCLVLDYDLGTLSGLDVKQRLDEALPDHPPVVMMTGDGRERTAIRAFRMGVDDYLPKLKLRPEFFVATVSKAVEKRRRRSLGEAKPRREDMVASYE